MENRGGIIFLGVLAACALFLPLLFRKRGATSYQLVPVRRELQQPAIAPAAYENTEEWQVEYNSDGLPIKVVVKRHATQI